MIFIFAIIIFLVFIPDIAIPCPLCQSAQGVAPETVTAYKSTTLLLALLPITVVSGLAYWIYNKYKRYEQ